MNDLAPTTATRDEAERLAPLGSAVRGIPYVYVLSDADGRAVYIGSTRDLRRRMREHQRRSPWWGDVSRIRAFPYSTLDEALRDEAALIDLAAPRHNRQHVRRWSEFEWSMRTFFPSLGDLRLRTLLDRAVA